MSESQFNGQGVEIYTWENCPYCRRAKRILDGDPTEGALDVGDHIEYVEHKIDGDAKGREEMTHRCEGHRTVPQILVDGERIGGCFDLVARIHAHTFKRTFRKYIRRG
ncbi:MAG: hypothetical protein K6A35_04840 [bacterium]|nr:hypothetical protein [bacterium]